MMDFVRRVPPSAVIDCARSRSFDRDSGGPISVPQKFAGRPESLLTPESLRP